MSLRGYIKKSKPATWTLVPGAKPITVALVKPTRIRSRSLSRQKAERQYAVQVAAWKIGRTCPCCGSSEIDCHHTRGRDGKMLLMQHYWTPVCRKLHDWIKNNPVEAREKGLLCEAGKWGTPG